MATLQLNDLHKFYGDVEVIKGVDLSVEDREFVVFVGPSGCGKSTLLRMIAGLEEISSGELYIDGELENDTPAAKRGLSMVFQSYALYPHMSVADNMGFSLKLAGVPREKRMEQVGEAARILQLEDYLDRRPKALSGGQRQRVAIGRAIVRKPRVFLFDEPLSNLDAALRVNMRTELARLHDALQATMIYVTHDQIEAMTLADKIVVLRDGLIEQVGAPLDLYHHPANLFVAGFIGSPKMNFLTAEVVESAANGTSLRLGNGALINVPRQMEPLTAGAPVTLGIRPEHIDLAEEGEIEGEVVVAERLGGATYLHVQLAPDSILIIEADGATPTRVHERVSLHLNAASCHVFDADGKAIASPS